MTQSQQDAPAITSCDRPVLEMAGRQRAEVATYHPDEHEQLINSITRHIRQSLNLEEILQTTVDEVRQFLQADRVVIYRMAHSDVLDAVVVESCHPEYPPLLGWTIHACPALPDCNVSYSSEIQAIADITQSELDPTCVRLLEAFAVKAQLTMPLLQESKNPLEPSDSELHPPSEPKLWGLLIAHQCDQPRQWQPEEIALLRQLENQILVAIQQAELYQQVHQMNADLEKKVAERTQELQQSLEFEALLKRITDKVRDSLDENQILQAAVQELGMGLEVYCCDTGVYSADYQTSTIRYEYTTMLPPVQGKIFSTRKDAAIYRHLLHGQPLQFCFRLPPVIRATDRRFSILACPIFDDQGTLGDLWLFRSRSRAFSSLEVRLVEQVANQCAIALRQSRLYQASQAQVAELAKLNQLKDDFLSTVSHELRTPLSTIRMSTQLLETLLHSSNPAAAQTQIDQCLQMLRDECDREIDLVGDILTLQHLEAGTHPLQPTAIHLQDWLPQVVESFEYQMQQHQQTLHTEIPAELPTLVSDLFILTRILKELLTNATKFTPPQGEVTLRCRITPTLVHAAATPMLHISIANTGVEIPPTEIDRIFNPFYRIPSPDPWKYGGTGMGLALVQKLVAYLNGSIWAESSPGRTCLTIALPLQPEGRHRE